MQLKGSWALTQCRRRSSRAGQACCPAPLLRQNGCSLAWVPGWSCKFDHGAVSGPGGSDREGVTSNLNMKMKIIRYLSNFRGEFRAAAGQSGPVGPHTRTRAMSHRRNDTGKLIAIGVVGAAAVVGTALAAFAFANPRKPPRSRSRQRRGEAVRASESRPSEASKHRTRDATEAEV